MHVWFGSISSLIWMLFHFKKELIKEELIKTDLERPDEYNLMENKLIFVVLIEKPLYLSQKLFL